MVRSFSVRTRDGAVICRRCRVANTALARMRGLLGRSKLSSDEGLMLAPCSSIHTWFMRYPIDVVFLESDLTVLGMREHVKPWRFAGWRRARNVLELAAGSCELNGVRPGSQLVLDDCGDETASVMLLLGEGEDAQVVVGRGPISAAGRTVSAMGELDVGVNAVVLRDVATDAATDA
jgi:uncharacterized membrane protein (UPF0127 family)